MSWCINLVHRHLIFVGPQHGTCFMSPILCLELWGGSSIFVKFVHPCSKLPLRFTKSLLLPPCALHVLPNFSSLLYKLQTFLLCCILHSLVTSPFLGPNIHFGCYQDILISLLYEWEAQRMWLQQLQIYLKLSEYSSFKYPEHCFWDDFINFKRGF